MTDTEQKALAASKGRCFQTEAGKIAWCNGYQSALQDHEAELREQAERFSEAASLLDEQLREAGFESVGKMRSILSPFILPEPEPDPLVEAMNEALGSEYEEYFPSQAEMLRDALAARGYKIERIEQ